MHKAVNNVLTTCDNDPQLVSGVVDSLFVDVVQKECKNAAQYTHHLHGKNNSCDTQHAIVSEMNET